MKAVVIIAHGWNAGWLGCYGNEWLATPNVDKLAADGVVFDQHWAVNPTTADWHRSLKSGRFLMESASPPAVSLIRELRSRGVRTIRIADVRDEQPSDDWDTSISARRTDDAPPGTPLLKQLKALAPSLADQDDWLLWLETDRLVPPWSVSLDEFDRYSQDLPVEEEGKPPAPWDEPPHGRTRLEGADLERLQATFASVVSEWDADLGKILNRLNKTSALVAIASGHGLSLGEHDWIGPDGELPYEELVHVPLLLKFPEVVQAGRRVDVPTATIDLLPTLFDWFKKEMPAGVHGLSLLPLTGGPATEIRPYTCVAMPNGSLAIRLPDWSLLKPAEGTPILIRKPEDRWDMGDQRILHLEWAEHLEEVLAKFTEANRTEPLVWPECKDYDEITHAETEEGDEHGAAGERGHERPEGEGDLRGHQGDQED